MNRVALGGRMGFGLELVTDIKLNEVQEGDVGGDGNQGIIGMWVIVQSRRSREMTKRACIDRKEPGQRTEPWSISTLRGHRR